MGDVETVTPLYTMGNDPTNDSEYRGLLAEVAHDGWRKILGSFFAGATSTISFLFCVHDVEQCHVLLDA